MQSVGIPWKLMKLDDLLYMYHIQTTNAIKADKKITEYFQKKTVVGHGCILLLCLFNLVLKAAMSLSLSNTMAGSNLNGE